MKYLKLFEAYPGEPIRPVPNTQVEDDIKDICIELEDLGFNIHINPYTGVIFIYRKHNMYQHIPFNFTEIKEVVKRIKDYLGSKLESIKAEKLNNYQDITSLDDHSKLGLSNIGNGMVSTVRIEYNSGLNESFDYRSHSRRGEISIEIEDRLIDLKDEGYIARVEKLGTDSNFKIYVHRTNGEKFSEQMVLPYIEHLVSYMDSNGYEMETTHGITLS